MSSFKGNICQKVSYLVALLLLVQVSFAQYDFKELDKLLSSAQKDIGKNAVVLVCKDGTPIYKKEIGEMKANEQIPIASCSKWLTTAIVMTLVDEGKLSLDDRVSKYLPIFEKYGKAFVTLRHCLTHQTGIQQEPVSLRSIVFRKKYTSLEDAVNDIASKKDIDYNPGEGFYYGSVGMDIAARICEVVTKRGFAQLATERLFRPLGMRGSSFANENDFEAAPNPSGGAHSSAIEYSNFTNMLLNKGIWKDKRILSDSAVMLMMQQQVNADKIRYAPKAAQGFTYALGSWIVNADINGKGQVFTCPGLFGSFPLIDYCKGYTLTIFTKSLLSEQKKEFYLSLKQSIETAIPTPSCD